MKKIVLYSVLAVAGMMFTACNDDYKDWNDPQSQPQPDLLTVEFQAASVNAIDLRSTEADSTVIFTPTIKANQPITVKYDAIIYNESKTDSVVVSANADGKALTSAIQGAVMALFGADEVQREAPMSVTAYVNYEGSIVIKNVDGLKLTATPKYQELPPVWFILGNCVGRGSGVNHKTLGLYTSTVAMYVNPFNYDELIYASYFCDAAEFKIIMEPGNKEWIIGADSGGNIVYQESTPEGASTPGNITIKNGGYYKITVNVKTKSLEITPITGTVKTYTQMLINNDPLAVITTNSKGENHDWLGEITVTEDGTDVTFTGTGDEDLSTSWGGKAFPAGKAVVNGTAIPAKAGKYKVVFNDLLGTYRFIPVN